MGPKATLRKIKKNLPLWLEQLPEMPELVYTYLQRQPSASIQTTILEAKNDSNHEVSSFWRGVGVASLVIAIIVLIFASTGELSQHYLIYLAGGVGIIGLLSLILTLGLKKLHKL